LSDPGEGDEGNFIIQGELILPVPHSQDTAVPCPYN